MAFFALTVSAYISIIYFALMMRVIMGMFTGGSGLLASFVYAVTEPILLPIRRKLDKMELFQDIPIDLSVLVAMIVLMLVTMLLPSVVY